MKVAKTGGRELHHGPTLWPLLERILPESPELKAELAVVGVSRWFGELSGTP